MGDKSIHIYLGNKKFHSYSLIKGQLLYSIILTPRQLINEVTDELEQFGYKDEKRKL